MKYFESNSDFTEVQVSTPGDLVRYIVTIVFLSPIRMCTEISRKILFTGEYLGKFLLNCIILNSIMVGLSLVYSIFILKGLRLTGGLLPIPSQVISLVLVVVLYLAQGKFSLPMDFTGSSNELEELDKYYNSEDEEIPESNTLIDNDSDYEMDELKIIDDENLKDEIFNIANSIPGELTETSKNRLDKLAQELKRDMNFSAPKANIQSLYSSVKDKEKECSDIMRKNKFIEDENVHVGGDIVETVKNSKRDFSDLLGDCVTDDDFDKAFDDEYKEQAYIAEANDEFYRAFEQMNPVEAFDDTEIHMKYEDSFNMNLQPGSTADNPIPHKFTQKEWEIPMGEKDTDKQVEHADEILSVYNNIKDLDDYVEDPIFDYNDLLADEDIL